MQCKCRTFTCSWIFVHIAVVLLLLLKSVEMTNMSRFQLFQCDFSKWHHYKSNLINRFILKCLIYKFSLLCPLHEALSWYKGQFTGHKQFHPACERDVKSIIHLWCLAYQSYIIVSVGFCIVEAWLLLKVRISQPLFLIMSQTLWKLTHTVKYIQCSLFCCNFSVCPMAGHHNKSWLCLHRVNIFKPMTLFLHYRINYSLKLNILGDVTCM